jgi:hypothetical protein
MDALVVQEESKTKKRIGFEWDDFCLFFVWIFTNFIDLQDKTGKKKL